uniref:M56 family metallopeptidase n=1 Tax=Acetatifactor sp. TaxID=1872090 RepID=UPI004055A321
MLNYSFATVYMAIIASNILLILITLLFRNTKIMVNAGYKLLALFIGLTALRFALPIEFPFTKTIFLTDWKLVSQLISHVRYPLWKISDFEISAWTFLQIIWLIGFIINLVRYIREHAKARYFILANSLDATVREPYASLMKQICNERSCRNRFRILTVTGIEKPMLYGVIKPCILIPEHMELSQNNLYYSLVHEAAHHFHHDLLIKKLIKIITMVYWWNPVCYTLIRRVDTILEMRIDDVVTASGEDAITKYLHTLLAIGEQATEQSALSKSVTMALLPEEDDELTQRFLMLLPSKQKKKLAINVLLFVGVIGIYVVSHLFIFEAYYTPPNVAEETIGQTADIMYAILNENGTYDIYYKGIYTETTDSLEYFDSSIPVYTEKEIVNEEH